jgi:hypothetical protein
MHSDSASSDIPSDIHSASTRERSAWCVDKVAPQSGCTVTASISIACTVNNSPCSFLHCSQGITLRRKVMCESHLCASHCVMPHSLTVSLLPPRLSPSFPPCLPPSPPSVTSLPPSLPRPSLTPSRSIPTLSRIVDVPFPPSLPACFPP